MFERLNTPEEAYEFKLGASLAIEETVLEILADSIDHAHVTNLQEVFGRFEWEVDDSPCPAIDGQQKEARANAKETDDAIAHEIGVYEHLILNAVAMGRQDVVAVLERNLTSEQSALQKVRSLQAEVAAATPKQPV